MVVPHPLFQPFLARYSVTVVLKGPPPGSSKKFSPLLLVLQKSRKTPNDWQFIPCLFVYSRFYTSLPWFFREFLKQQQYVHTFTQVMKQSLLFFNKLTPDLQPIPQTSNQYPRPPTDTPDLQPIPQTSNRYPRPPTNTPYLQPIPQTSNQYPRPPTNTPDLQSTV